MKRFWLDETECHAPTGWHECRSEQICNGLMLQQTIAVETDPLKRAHYKIGMLRTLLDAPTDLLERLSGPDLQELVQMIDWSFSARVHRIPFPSFEFEGVTYLLPAERFANTTAIEVAMANIYYLQFTHPDNPQTNAVLLLVATLCRPTRTDLDQFRASKAWTGDEREEYNSIIAQEQATTFGRLSFGVVMAVLQYFEVTNHEFLRQYGEAFGADDDDEPLYKNGEGWIACLEDVAEAGVHGKFTEVCSENAHTIWLYLKHRAARNKRQEEEQRRQERLND
jgi:hypothetical protein